MLLTVKEKISEENLKKVAEDFEGYVKVVVDLRRKILSAGGTKQVDGEQMLLQAGSQQRDLWGGGYDLETGEIDFDSMINIRPNTNNPSREVLDKDIRDQMTEIILNLMQIG